MSYLIPKADPNKCEWCDEEGVGFTDDGRLLCAECFFQYESAKIFDREEQDFEL